MGQAWKLRASHSWVAAVVVVVAVAPAVGCFNPAPVDSNLDALGSVDATPLDAAVDAPPTDAPPIEPPPGANPELARAPKTCDTQVSGADMTASFSGWTATLYTGGATADQRYYKCAATNVFALSSSYVAPRNPAGFAPSISYRRDAMFLGPAFEFAYTVESITTPGESGIVFAGGYARSRDPGVAFTQSTLDRRASDGMVMLRTLDQNGMTIASKNIGVLVAPYRVRWRGTRVGGTLQSVITIFTATTTTDYIAANVPLPDPAIELRFGLNRFEVGATSRMVFSDLVLP
ncbi:MAG: hypothetical protein KBG15_21225 [Kofleriaceae bacterium]|nr:hypothetical protein [Kofleriaceae bacterium]